MAERGWAWEGGASLPAPASLKWVLSTEVGVRPDLGAERITPTETPGGASNSASGGKEHPASHLEVQPWASLSRLGLPQRQLMLSAEYSLCAGHLTALISLNSRKALAKRERLVSALYLCRDCLAPKPE